MISGRELVEAQEQGNLEVHLARHKVRQKAQLLGAQGPERLQIVFLMCLSALYGASEASNRRFG